MSKPDATIDLGAFARPESKRDIPAPRRRWLAIVITLVLIGAFGAIFWTSARSVFEKPIDVTILRPKSGALQVSGGSVLFQAAGWVEPDPFPISVPALTKGTIAEILVQESDPVTKGQVVGRLIADDSQLELEQANAAVAVASAQRGMIAVEFENAKIARRELVQKTEKRDVAAAELKVAEANHQKHYAQRDVLAARIAVARADLKTQKFLASRGADGPWQVELAQGKLDEWLAEDKLIDSALVEGAFLVEVAKAHEQRARRDFQLTLEEDLRVQTAETALAKADADLRAKEVAVKIAQLAHSRIEIRSPAQGIVLTQLVTVGQHLGPEARDGDGDICTLYDPANLRVRVDVPQNQIGLLAEGQLTRIQSESRREPYQGRVLRIVQKADIQKVTLEVQVRIENPDQLLKPEMLAQVAFLAAETKNSAETESQRTILIPRRLIDGSNEVWVVDGSSGRARRRSLTTAQAQGDWVPVLSGLNLSDKLIDRGRGDVKEGSALRIKEVSQ
ncbi:MAG: HlyD family efflux transporter periplasmic adaptor subunit [Planctomycetota bacterium]